MQCLQEFEADRGRQHHRDDQYQVPRIGESEGEPDKTEGQKALGIGRQRRHRPQPDRRDGDNGHSGEEQPGEDREEPRGHRQRIAGFRRRCDGFSARRR